MRKEQALQDSLTSSTVASATAQRMAFADGLRAIAVVWVMIFHIWAGGHMPLITAWSNGGSIEIFASSGYLGVSIFFVLSGYVMALTTERQDMGTRAAGRFVLRRLVRLTPPLYVCVAVCVAIAWAEAWIRPQTGSVPSLPSIFAHLFYMQGVLEFPLINDVLWTLAIEVQFYIAFALLLLLAHLLVSRTGWVNSRLMVGAMSALLAAPWALGLVQDSIWPGGFIGFWYSFMLGVLARWYISGMRHAGVILSGLAIVVMIGAITGPSANAAASLLTAGALLWAFLARSEDKWLGGNGWQFLGKISYSIYLLHVPVQGICAFILAMFLPSTVFGEVLKVTALLVVPVLVSYLAWRWVERPSIEWSKRIRIRPSRQSPVEVSA